MKPPTCNADVQRLLGSIRLAAKRAKAANGDLDRQVARAVAMGCSLRDVASAAGFDSHHKVQQIVARSRTS